MRARVTRQRGPSRPKPGLPGRGQARTVRPPAALRCPELAHKAAWNRLISGLATRAYSLGAAPRQESGYILLRALADVSARMAAVLHGRRLVPGHEGGHPDQDVSALHGSCGFEPVRPGVGSLAIVRWPSGSTACCMVTGRRIPDCGRALA